MKKKSFLSLILCLLMLASCGKKEGPTQSGEGKPDNSIPTGSSVSDSSVVSNDEDIPAYDGKAYVPVNGNEPLFTSEEMTTKSFESYSDLDDLGRCGVAYACVGQDLMPTEERGNIGSIKPTGWHSEKYDCVDGKYLYNRCHLIGYQLTAENANEKNLITGTRYLNIDGMLGAENMVADYIKETGNHVLYRVTPIFEGNNLVAAGVLMEGWSVEDEGDGICYCIFAYNVQPGVAIDYATGESWLDDGSRPSVGSNIVIPKGDKASNPVTVKEPTYIGNSNSKKFHSPNCSSLEKLGPGNRVEFFGTRQEVLDAGFEPCGICKP